MRILVDADACPVKTIIVRCAKAQGLSVIMFTDTSHIINDGYSTVITVDKAADNVDFALMVALKPNDCVVTQDYGLAAMALGKGAFTLNQNGLIFTNENIDELLMQRHLSAKARRAKNRAKGPSKRTKEDDARFEDAFVAIISKQS